MTTDPNEAPGSAARAQAICALVLVVLAIATAFVRVRVALDDPQFDARDPSGMLKSDPALLHHLVEHIVGAGGAIPDEFARDTALEHPDTIDVAERFPLGYLRVVAWAQLASGDGTPLHVTATWVAALLMGCASFGVYAAAHALSRSRVLALLAAVLAVATPAFHRTIGFVLVDEDAFWPLYALHLGLAARAAVVRTPGAVLAAALAAAAALATWHAAGFVLAIEAAVLLGALLVTGRSALAVRGGACVPIALVATSLAVPFLRASGAAASFPVAAAVGIWAASRARAPNAARAVGVLATALVLAVGAFAAGSASTYAHVYALFAAKIEHFGIRPATAAGLSPDVRVMWQGPFETPSLEHAVRALSIAGALGVAAAAWAIRSARIDTRTSNARDAAVPRTCFAALFVAALAAAWFAERALVLPALIAPALAAWAATRVRHGAWILAGVAVAQIALTSSWLASYANPWYHAPVQRQAEIRWMVETVERVVPRDAAVAADFMSSTAILARSGNPIVFSPKWEAREPRRRAAEFIDAFHHRSPSEFRALIVDRYRARWLVIDRFTLQFLAHWSAGLPADSFDPLPGTAAAALLSQDDAALRSIPGYELVARSPATILQSNGKPTDFYRVYRLAE